MMLKEEAELRSCYLKYLEGKKVCALDNEVRVNFERNYSTKIGSSLCI